MRNKVDIPEVKFKLEIKFKHTENSHYMQIAYIHVCLCWLPSFLCTHIQATDMHRSQFIIKRAHVWETNPEFRPCSAANWLVM